jgi:hypothetical protein
MTKKSTAVSPSALRGRTTACITIFNSSNLRVRVSLDGCKRSRNRQTTSHRARPNTRGARTDLLTMSSSPNAKKKSCTEFPSSAIMKYKPLYWKPRFATRCTTRRAEPAAILVHTRMHCAQHTHLSIAYAQSPYKHNYNYKRICHMQAYMHRSSNSDSGGCCCVS